MNIFFLHKDPEIAARYHCDKHIVKMAIEYTQILSTVLHVTNSVTNEWAYRATHIHHPCVKWTGQSLSHWKWLWLLGHHVGNEYTRRYGKMHAAIRKLRNLPVPNKLPDLGWISDPPQAMPIECKSNDCVEAYRKYYIIEKAYFAKWRTEVPNWFKLP